MLEKRPARPWLLRFGTRSNVAQERRQSKYRAENVGPHKVVFQRKYRSCAFTYTLTGRERYATPLPSPLVLEQAPGPAFSQASTLLPAAVTYTTYSYSPDATSVNDGTYGQSAYNALWAKANLTWSSSTLPFTTTVEPTPVASSELVFPPPLPLLAPSGDYTLPDDFLWGVASSAWQVEGALQAEGRGPAPDVDRLGSLPNTDGTSDGVTNAMNYYLYKQDIARIAAMGVPHYSFSISWSRILPFGVANSPVNLEAIGHYDDLINTCLEYGITPIVTLWHFDTPMLVDLTNDSMIDDFVYYAKVVIAHYGDRVPIWITFNEANIGFTYLFKDYNTLTRMAIAHAEVYHWYKEELEGTGRLSMKFANNLAYPLHGPSNASDVDAALRYQEIVFGIMGNPLLLGQQIPDSALTTLGARLTPLTQAQMERLNGTVDFFALDHYTAQFATALPGGIDQCVGNPSHPAFPFCVELSNVQGDGWLSGDASNSYVYITPQYMRQQLKYIWDVYRPAGGIVVSEFGFPVLNEARKTLDQQRFDLERSIYYEAFLQEVLAAIHEDGVKVMGAIAWAATDNNEWGSFVDQFGLQVVNRTDEVFARTYKRSFFDLVDFFERHIGSGGCGSQRRKN
ncbi:beta-glucosidase [Thozetella sp. PMI_491]|nr:beta-glucosidase [Thozetella sp. PMI_491]